MPNLTVTQNKVNGIVVWEPIFQPELVTFTAAGTLAAGTILARSTATLKMVPFVIGGVTAGNGIPSAVLINDVTATAAGDVSASPLIGGQVRTGDLVTAAAGTITAAELDALRSFGIIGRTTNQLSIQDNE